MLVDTESKMEDKEEVKEQSEEDLNTKKAEEKNKD